jgi:uncharacterized repeat protein (TIGR01451 family)
MKFVRLLFVLLSCCIFSSFNCYGQAGYVFTIAGGGGNGNSPNNVPALGAQFNRAGRVGKDPTGNIYIHDIFNYHIRKVDVQTGQLYIIAGNGNYAYAGDGGPAVNASFSQAFGMGMDGLGNVYLADMMYGRIRKVDAVSGIITTVAGGGSLAICDDCLATEANLGIAAIRSIFVDPVGDVYFGYQGRIKKIDAATGRMTTIAGNGLSGYSGDGGLAINAGLKATDIVTDARGNIFFTQEQNRVVRRIDGQTGIITTIAGNATDGYSGDGGQAINAQLHNPGNIQLDINENIYITDEVINGTHNGRIRMINSSGIINTIAGSASGNQADGIPALSASIYAWSMFVDKYSNVFWGDYWDEVRMMAGDSLFQTSTINSFTVHPSSICDVGFRAIIGTQYYSTNHSVKTYFGDGNFETKPIEPGWGGGYSVITHNYSNTGDYMVKHILYHGSVAVDSNQYVFHNRLCRTLSADLYIDDNNDCIYDEGVDHNMMHPIAIAVDSNGSIVDTLSATAGYRYNAYGNNGDVYNFHILDMPEGISTSCPLNGIIRDTLYSSTQNNPKRFAGFNCAASTNFDLNVKAHLRAAANRLDADVIVHNEFCTQQNGELTFTFSPEYEFNPNDHHCVIKPPPTSQTPTSITWNLNNLSITEYPKYLHVTLWATNYQYLTPGNTVQSTFSLTPTLGDIAPANNIIVRQDTVTGPYDPNAVYVSPSGCVVPGTRLQYTVTFENLGNDTAHNIYIMDTLSSGFEMQSMKILAASHVMNITKVSAGGYNILKFEFPNINLPDSSSPDRHGMVMYTIDMVDNFPIGSAVTNKAGIYFDYMPAVLTNVASTTACWPANVNEVTTVANSIHIYPNPATEQLTIKTEQAYSSYTITNSIGQVMMSNDMNGKESKVDIKSLATGIYYLSLLGEGGTEVSKFVKL